jgi:hypothetical protein
MEKFISTNLRTAWDGTRNRAQPTCPNQPITRPPRLPPLGGEAGVNGAHERLAPNQDWAGPLARGADQRGSSDSPKLSTSRKSRTWELALYSSLITVAGTPATRVAGGTWCVTTAPAATTESAPIVTPGRIVAAVAIHTFVSIVIGSAVM